jgi:hypothetical protein
MATIAYMNNTTSDVSMFHAAIMDAIKNGGVFGDDLADIFVLTKTPEGSTVDYALTFA